MGTSRKEGTEMITPDYLNEIIEGTEYAVRKAESTILNKICKRIVASFNANEENIIIPSTITQMHQLMDLGMTQQEIQEVVTKSLPSIQKEVREAFLRSAHEISDYNTDIAKEIIEKEGFDIEIPQYESVGLPKESAFLNMTASEIRTLEQIYSKTNRTVTNMCKSFPVAGSNLYMSACDDAFTKIQSGLNPNTAIIDAIHQVSTDGLKIVSYDSGHVDRSEVAVARAVRSGINKANAEIVLTRCAEMGVGFVRVSEHYGARVTKQEDFTNHAHWQGKVYSLNWNSSIFKEKKVDKENRKQLEDSGFGWLNELRDKLEEKKTPLIENKKDVVDNSLKTKEEYIKNIENVLNEAYEYQRINNNLNLTPANELTNKKYVTDKITMYEEKILESLQNTLDNLASKYETSLQKIGNFTKDEFLAKKDALAFVYHDYDYAKSTMKLNSRYFKNYKDHVEKIDSLAKSRYIVNIPKEYYDKYVFTHEFAHTLIDTGSKLTNSRNFTKLDYKKIKKARTEITNVYNKYLNELQVAENAWKSAELDAMMNVTEETFEKARNLRSEYDKIFISRYAMNNADEFMAECFTLAQYTETNNIYVKEIMDIINKNFARK